jgi:hypothetical protein
MYICVFRLWAKKTDCREPPCVCHVKIDGSEEEPQRLEFQKEDETLGPIDISDLKSNTNYLFTLTCELDKSPISRTITITTDYGRPEAPKNINVSLASEHVQITWSAPSIPLESFSYYKILMDNKIIEPELLKSKTSYNITKALEEGKHILNMATCYINKQNAPKCSNSADAQVSFTKATTTATTAPASPPTPPTAASPTPAPPTPAPPKASGVCSYSFSIPTIILSLLFVSKI